MAESFITEVRAEDNAQNAADPNPLLDDVREQHKKILHVVDALGKKIDLMKEKQRLEYMQVPSFLFAIDSMHSCFAPYKDGFLQAYEVHMQDVQKELHNMRELVSQIADEKTKKAKIQQLKKDQIFYRQEAVRLDSE